MRKQITVAGTFISMALGCAGDPPTYPGPSTAPLPSVQALSPTTIEDGVVGAFAAVAPAVQVRDGKTGQPLAGVTIDFFPVRGGAVRNSQVVTDADGIASAGEWEFSRAAGVSEVSVWVNGVGPRLSFRATVKPDVPTTLYTEAPLDRLGLIGENVNLSVVVHDRFGNAVPNVEVTFTVTDGGGTVSDEKITSNQYGRAVMPSWTLGPNPGANTLSVSASGVEMLVFHTLGVDPATVKWFELDSLRNGDFASSLQSWGISEGRIGFLSADRCMCISAQGDFIRTIKYTDGTSQSSSGFYKLVGNALISDTEWYTAVIEGDKVVLSAWEPWEEEYLITWIYKSLDASKP